MFGNVRIRNAFISAAGMLLILLLAAGCGSAGNGGNSVDYERITITEWGSMANTQEYEFIRTDTGAVLSYYDGDWTYNEEADREDSLLYRIEGDEAFYEEMKALASECGVVKWDGFSKSNPNVLDGSSFSFSAELSDGRALSARGSNSFPKGFGDFTQALYARLKEAAAE